jgi:hypothetical protein
VTERRPQRGPRAGQLGQRAGGYVVSRDPVRSRLVVLERERDGGLAVAGDRHLRSAVEVQGRDVGRRRPVTQGRAHLVQQGLAGPSDRRVVRPAAQARDLVSGGRFDDDEIRRDLQPRALRLVERDEAPAAGPGDRRRAAREIAQRASVEIEELDAALLEIRPIAARWEPEARVEVRSDRDRVAVGAECRCPGDDLLTVGERRVADQRPEWRLGRHGRARRSDPTRGRAWRRARPGSRAQLGAEERPCGGAHGQQADDRDRGASDREATHLLTEPENGGNGSMSR